MKYTHLNNGPQLGRWEHVALEAESDVLSLGLDLARHDAAVGGGNHHRVSGRLEPLVGAEKIFAQCRHISIFITYSRHLRVVGEEAVGHRVPGLPQTLG